MPWGDCKYYCKHWSSDRHCTSRRQVIREKAKRKRGGEKKIKAKESEKKVRTKTEIMKERKKERKTNGKKGRGKEQRKILNKERYTVR